MTASSSASNDAVGDDRVAVSERVFVIGGSAESAAALRELVEDEGAPHSAAGHRVEWTSADARTLRALTPGPADVAFFELTDGSPAQLALFHLLRELQPRLPVVVLSGADDEDLAEEILRGGGSDFLLRRYVNRRRLRCVLRAIAERRRIEEELARERDMLRTVIDNLPALIYVKDRESRYILDNETHARFIGAAAAGDVEGKSVLDVFPGDIGEKFYEDDQRLMRTGESILGVEEKTIDHAGHPLWMSTTKVPLRDSTGRIVGLVGLSSDITDRKRAQERAQRTTADLARKNAEMEANLVLAREFHQSLLPAQTADFPSVARPGAGRLSFAQRFVPGGELGGDFFDIRPIDDRRVALFLCDVMGHDVRAALVAAMLQTLARRRSAESDDPGVVLTQMNADFRSILQRTDQVIFASAVLAIVDAATGTVALANAGHPSPILRRRDAGSAEVVSQEPGSMGAALGLLDASRYASRRLALGDGDVLFLYTDGICEARWSEGARDGEEFGEERLCAAVAGGGAGGGVAGYLEAALAAACRHTRRAAFDDDVCMLGVSWTALGR